MVGCDDNRNAVMPQHFRGQQTVAREQTASLVQASPKSGFGFLEVVIRGVISRAGSLVGILDAPHQHGGNPGFPAEAMLSAFVMQFVLNERYANGFLDRLGSHDRLLAICGLEYAPSEGAYSRFKKKLSGHLEAIKLIVADVFRECGDEIERLREAGIAPADKPPLGHSLVVDSTDIEAWARPSRKSRKTGEEIPSKDLDAQWGHRTAKNPRSKSSSGKRRKRGKSQKAKADGSDGDESGNKDSKDESYFGYKVDVIADSNHGLPMFARKRAGKPWLIESRVILRAS